MNMLQFLILLVVAVALLVAYIFWYAKRREPPLPRASENIEDVGETDPSEVDAAIKLDSVTRRAERGDLPFMRAIKNPDNVSAPDFAPPANAPAPSAISADESSKPTPVKVEPSLDDGGAGVDAKE